MTEFAVDRSGLVDYTVPARPSPESLAAKEELTPLAADLRSLIQLRGPISVMVSLSLALSRSLCRRCTTS